ncbi:MAG: T9SS type A sorting domain-containing protein [Candidatus Limimorpha sp.]
MPVSPDVVELAAEVTTLPQTFTQSTADLYDNYKLPGNKPDAADAVYQLVFSETTLFNAEVTEGSNVKLALYAEDFAGRPGPMADNYIGAIGIGNNGQYSISIGGDNPITNLMVMPGTYYLVVSTTSPQYTLQISTNELPLPLQAAFVAPIDGATGITSPVQLQWQLGSFTSEYQLLIGTTYPPNEVLVDWTTELAESYVVDNLHNNQIYFWRVNERNASGTTNGSVWGFTTTLNIPSGLHANTPIHIGDDVLLEWNAVSGRAIVGYNVYQDGEKINEAPITATEYIVSDLAYNMEGYTFAVTAVYNEGESGMSEPVMVCVGGIGTISGTVYEQDGSTPIVGVAVTVTGYDEFLERHTYIYLTEANGTFSGTVYSGKYIAIASKEGYQEGSHGSEVLVSNDAETSYVDIILYENYNTTGRVVAEYYPDSLNSESPYVKVYWESENVPEPIGPGWHTYCENEFNNAVACVKWGYQYPLSELQPYIGFMMTKVALFSDKLFGAVGGNYTCRIYVGGTEPEEGEMVSTITVDVPQNLGDWVEFDLTNPVEISGIEPVWVIWQANTTVSDYPAGCCLGFNTYGTWCWSDDGYDWTHNPYGIWTMKQFFTDGEGRIVDRSFQHYNVYRTNCYNNGPYTEENTVLLASEVTDTIFIETGWPDVEQGVYKWGVSRVYGGNRESETACSKSDSYENRAQVLLRSINAYSFSRYSRIIPNGWVQYDPLHPQNSATLIDQNLQLCAGDFANDGYMHAFTEENQLLTFDPSSGQIVATVNTTTHMDDCAFDYSTGTMFGVKDNVLYSIDLESGSLSALGFLDHGAPSHCIRALACSYSGQLYGFLDEFGALFAIEKSSAHCTLIQQIAMLLSTDMTAGFDHNTETLYWMCVGIPDEGTGFIASVDVNTGNIIYLASGMGIQKCFSVPYGYVPIPVSPESEIVWSNCLDKDMWTTVEVSISTNTGDSPAGTSVRFLNTSEPDQGYDYIVTLDNSGYYKWDRFRKGTYNYTIEKDGYTSCGNHEIIEIMRPDSIGCILEELPLNVRNLYVSHTGWAMWQQGLGGDVLHYDTDTFDGSVGASGNPFYWAVRFTPEQLEGFHSVNSVSFYDAPDQAFIGTFYVCSTGSPLGHILYQKDIVTTGSGQYIDYPLERDVVFDDTQDLWIVFQFKEGEATYPASASTNTGDLNGRLISSNGLVWDDVAAFGLNYTWKIRCHVKAEEEERTLEYYSVFLNDIFVGNTTETYFQHDVDNLVEGEINTTKVKAMYSMGESLWAEYTWTYIPCDEYESTSDLEAEVNNGHVLLNWTLPENQISGGEWYYYDNSINSGSVGTGGGSFYWGIMIPVGSWSGHYLGKVSIYDMAAYTGNILIYQGGQTAPGTLIYSQPFVSAGSNQWGEYPINDLVELDESQNLWVVFNNVGSASYPASYSEDSGDPNGRWISMDGVGWHDLTEYDIQGTWMIRAYATNEEPVVYDILGTYVFRDSELITEMPLPRTINTFVDNLPTADEHEYSVRVVYNNLPIYQDNYYAMSCPVSETVSNVLDVSDNKDGVVVNIYPNPAKDKVVIQAKGMRHVTIADALGQVVHDTDQKADRMILSMSQFESGLYLIQVTTERGMVTRRVTVVR